MSTWQQDFARKMEGLREKSFDDFDRFVEDQLEPAFDSINEFLIQWRFHTSQPATNAGHRSFKFSLTEDGYVLVTFRLEGVDALTCEYECCVPGIGRTSGVSTSTSLRGLEPGWGDSCFQMALNDFVSRFAGAQKSEKIAEPALA